MKYIGFDIGSSFVKIGLFDLDKATVDDVRLEPAPPQLAGELAAIGGRYEVDADAIAAIVRKHVLRFVRLHREAVAGIVLATQMHGFVLADEYGRAVTPYISWQDRRGHEPRPDGSGESAADTLERLLGPGAPARAGLRLKPGLALCNLYRWLEEHPPGGERERAREFHTLGSFVLRRLTGAYATHLSSAAATGLADVACGRWNERTIASCGFGFLRFPAIRGETECVGAFRGRYRDIPVFPDIGDHQATVFGCFALPGEEAVATIGTAGLLARETAAWADAADGWEMRPSIGGSYLRTVSRLPGGRSLDVLIAFVRTATAAVTGREPSSARVWRAALREAEAAARAAPTGARLPVELGFFPGQLGSGHGVIGPADAANLRLGPLFLGAFDHMAGVYRDMLERLDGGEAVTPGDGGLKRLLLSGGVARRSALLRERLAAVTGLACDLPPYADEALAGLFRLALLCAGVCRTPEETRHYAPRDNSTGTKGEAVR
ncbi:sedoheptulokinase [Paenibacillus cymbidii]|uniref:sedoheptulokinase n=1 Tax=Paenibacillus cymbidii TaxID=1639034 RepID=UPI0010814A33|nr:FGGY family carbohydrate kinase [Paenibacillus cymbidii]